ncbi:uncharacterized protein LOC125542337 isoform X3 [Triticum urartu]|uniref:uncharacterized protein LOC125542337 isoform X3 n=1 Tax=Triticum urartu TaxID=4572 RepID=UPI0020431B63|nr:uncharacterized protein LOC125542337 isoform X3 [Triticum urartu]XP_048561290.1 uncharacterized protein LOC125542337 isoform X3 [Triticum urartu]XP_048561291.1 uncharacterized protein LOC125542337 isoform X3 [Triticum urartu]
MLSIMSPLSTPEEQAPSSPLSTPEEPAPCSPEFLIQRSTVSPTVATTEVPKTSDRTQVEAKEIRLSDMPPVTLDDRNMHIKTDDTSEMNIPEDFDNRPSKKAKNSESGVLEPSPMSFMAYKDDLEWSLRVPATGLWSRRRAVTRELIPGHQRAPAAKKAANSGLNYGNQDLGDRLGDLRGGCVISMHWLLP